MADNLNPSIAAPWYCRFGIHSWSLWGEAYVARAYAYQRHRCLLCGKVCARRIGLSHYEHDRAIVPKQAEKAL